MDATELKGKTGLRRMMNAFGYSIKGFQTAWNHEAAFRQEIMFCTVLIPVALWLNVSVIERIALIGVLALVIIVELINSAIEAAVDRIGTESHYLSGAAKDLGSAAVLVAITLTAFVWGSVLWDVLSPIQ